MTFDEKSSPWSLHDDSSPEDLYRKFTDFFRTTNWRTSDEALESFRRDIGTKLPERFHEDWHLWTVSCDPGETSQESLMYLRFRDRVFSASRATRESEPARFLVLGDVQAGKTSSYTNFIKEVMTRRANGGIGPNRFLFVVLTGVHEKLRAQTDWRLDTATYDMQQKQMIVRPCAGRDVGKDLARALKNSAVSGSKPVGYILTVKKVAGRLDHLRRMLDSPQLSDILSGYCVIFIDDECDQVTTDLARSRKRNAIRISDIVWHGGLRKVAHSVAYVGYSATPFANIMLSSDRKNSMFPGSGILRIPPGEGYMGRGYYFGEQGNRDVVEIPASEVRRWRESRRNPSRASIEDGSAIADSILWFIHGAAAKRKLPDVSTPHSTMMIHAHTQVSHHQMMRREVDAYLQHLKELGDGELAAAHHELLERVTGDRFSAVGEPPSVRDLRGVLDQVCVVEDHSRSDERLEYRDEEPCEVIVIGGHTLSRGLTLEGLISSYFSRTGDFAYDTYVQFCRWFGYRGGYEHLTRVWLSGEDAEDFRITGRCIDDLVSQIEEAEKTMRGRPEKELQEEISLLIDRSMSRLPSKTLDAARLVGQDIVAGRPVPTRFFSPSSPRWKDSEATVFADRLSVPFEEAKYGIRAEAVPSSCVRDFLEQEAAGRGSRLIDRVGGVLEEGDWDVLIPLSKKGASRRTVRIAGFDVRRSRQHGRTDGDGIYIKDFTSAPWRKTGSRPLLILLPIEAGPDGGSWNDIAAAIVFEKDAEMRLINSSLTVEEIEDLQNKDEQ